MKKTIKKATAVATAMAMVMGMATSVYAEQKSKYTGTIAESDLTINMDLPADGSLTIKPFAGTQITTAPLYFKNKNTVAAAIGDDDVAYLVKLAGYTCVATSINDENPIVAKKTLTANSKAKEFAANIALGEAVASTDEKTDAKDFKVQFVTEEALAIDTLSEESYDGTADTAYVKNADATAVQVDPAKSVPFRITGTMNTDADWEEGDAITIVPVFSIGVKVTPKVS